MSQIAIIGDKETIFPFQAIGFETLIADAENVKEIFKKAVSEKKLIIFITEELVLFIEKEVNDTMKKPYPIVTLIPSVLDSEESSREDIVKLIEKVVGPNLMKEE